MEYQVSVVVVSYNPICRKLLTTLQRIIDQKDILVEIILCDDCSTGDDYFSEAEKLFLKNNFKNYKMYRNKTNKGIVENFYGGIMKAKGEYVFMGSPGDYFYDEYTLKHLYDFARSKQAQVCFGNAVYYNEKVDGKIVYDVPGHPYNTDMYDERRSVGQQQIGCLFGNHPQGAIIFRTREYAIKYIGIVRKVCKYAEDVSTWVSSLDGIRTYYYDGFILWYEYGTGLSTNFLGNHEMMFKDEAAIFEFMMKRYPGNKLIEFYRTDRYTKGMRRRFLFWTKYMRLWFLKKKIQIHGTKLRYTKKIELSKFPDIGENG